MTYFELTSNSAFSNLGMVESLASLFFMLHVLPRIAHFLHELIYKFYTY